MITTILFASGKLSALYFILTAPSAVSDIASLMYKLCCIDADTARDTPVFYVMKVLDVHKR